MLSAPPRTQTNRTRRSLEEAKPVRTLNNPLPLRFHPNLDDRKIQLPSAHYYRLLDAAAAQRREDGGGVPVLQRPGDCEHVFKLGGRIGGVGAAQDLADLLDRIRGKLGDVGEGALPGLSALAVGLADQDRGPRVAVGDNINKHGYSLSHNKPFINGKISQCIEEMHGYILLPKKGRHPPQPIASEGKKSEAKLQNRTELPSRSKAARKRAADVHSFLALLADLSTVVLNDVSSSKSESFKLVTASTPGQRKAFDLLGVNPRKMFPEAGR